MPHQTPHEADNHPTADAMTVRNGIVVDPSHPEGRCSCGTNHTGIAEPQAPREDTVTDQQWNTALTHVGKAVKRAKTAGPDDCALAPPPSDTLRERAVDAMVAWLRDRHDDTVRTFNEDGIREDLTGIADAMLAAVEPDLSSLRGERDRARDTAVTLENRLTVAEEALRDLRGHGAHCDNVASDEEVDRWEAEDAATEDAP